MWGMGEFFGWGDEVVGVMRLLGLMILFGQLAIVFAPIILPTCLQASAWHTLCQRVSFHAPPKKLQPIYDELRGA